jgi:hypothetical protein
MGRFVDDFGWFGESSARSVLEWAQGSCIVGDQCCTQTGTSRSYFFRSRMGQIKNKDHCSEPRNTAPKFPNDMHIQLLRGREQCPSSSSTTSRMTDEASTNWRPLRPILIKDEVKTSYTRRPLKPILYNRNVKRVLTSLLLIDTLVTTKKSNLQPAS